MVLNLKEQEQRIRSKLAYYKKIIPVRDVSYGAHKTRNIIPRLIRALHKVREGTYGVCDECQDPIPVERLQVIPGAILCVSCKAAEE